MKTKWIVIILLVVAVGVLIFLNEKGIIHWQALTILGAAVLGPFKYILSLFDSDKDKIAEINAQHEAVRLQEKKYQEGVAAELKKRDEAIAKLNTEHEAIQKKLKAIEEEKKNIPEKIAHMTDEEKADKGRDLFGN